MARLRTARGAVPTRTLRTLRENIIPPPAGFRQNRRTTESTETASGFISVVSVDSVMMSTARGYLVCCRFTFFLDVDT